MPTGIESIAAATAAAAAAAANANKRHRRFVDFVGGNQIHRGVLLFPPPSLSLTQNEP